MLTPVCMHRLCPNSRYSWNEDVYVDSMHFRFCIFLLRYSYGTFLGLLDECSLWGSLLGTCRATDRHLAVELAIKFSYMKRQSQQIPAQQMKHVILLADKRYGLVVWSRVDCSKRMLKLALPKTIYILLVNLSNALNECWTDVVCSNRLKWVLTELNVRFFI